MEGRLSKKSYYYHIDFIRFILALFVIFSHTLMSNIIPYVKLPEYEAMAQILQKFGASFVQLFFMLSGFFQYRSFKRNPDMSVLDYICDRVVRLWPAMFFALVMEAVTSGKFNLQRMPLDAFFLQCSGLSLEYKGIMWYTSSLFFASILHYAILKACSERKAGIVISLLTYFSLTFLVNYCDGRLDGRETVLYVLNMGTLRGVAFIGLGILLSMISDYLSGLVAEASVNPRTGKRLVVGTLILEIAGGLFCWRYFSGKLVLRNEMVYVIVYSVLLLCAVSETDPVGKLCANSKWMGNLGKYAYSMYVMQQTGFNILMKTMWQNEQLLYRVKITMILSVAFCAALGIAVYYLVERPAVMRYTRWKKARKAAQAAKV